MDIISHLFGFFNTFLAFYGIYRHFLFKKRVALILIAKKLAQKTPQKVSNSTPIYILLLTFSF